MAIKLAKTSIEVRAELDATAALELLVHLLGNRLGNLMRVGFLDACDKTTVYRAADYLVKRYCLFALDNGRHKDRRARRAVHLRPDLVEYDGLVHHIFLRPFG